MSTFVIAEIGSCHDGYLGKALSLLDVVQKAGADAAKFQYWSSAKRLAERRRAFEYEPIYAKYAMPPAWLPGLKYACEERGLEFMCTAYLPEDVPFVAPYVGRFKVASFEANDQEFLEAHLPYGKEIVCSTGMDSFPSVPATLLHCVSAYPTPHDQACLAALQHGPYSGFSDHTACIYTGAFAVCAGASMLEVHVRGWDTQTDNPDYATALDPGQFGEYVRLVRLAERMLGDGHKRMMPAEEAMAKYRTVVPT